jgi:hypothetical protein
VFLSVCGAKCTEDTGGQGMSVCFSVYTRNTLLTWRWVTTHCSGCCCWMHAASILVDWLHWLLFSI